MPEKTAEQIRRETAPVKYNGLVYGALGVLLGGSIWFGGWGLLHQEQLRRYPEYVVYAIKGSTNGFSFSPFGPRSAPQSGMNADELRYELLRFGNEDHHLDAEIIRQGWYPPTARPADWVRENGAFAPIYTDSPALVFKWPFALTLLTVVGALICGLVSDRRYRSAIIAGIPFDGTVVATVDEYNREVKGDGMRYRVKPWKDR
jgi:hypothetical protein